MKAVGSYILVSEIVEEVTTKDGLILVGDDADVMRYMRGKVVSAGDLVIEGIGEGNIIYYNKNSGYSMLIGEDKFTVIQERDVVVVE